MKKSIIYILSSLFVFLYSCNKETRYAIDTEDPIEVSACRATFKATGKNGTSKKIKEKGFCYSANGIPTIDDNPTPSTNGFVDLFEAEVKGLTANTSYQIRAYTKFTDGSIVMGDLNEFSTNGNYMVGDIGPAKGMIYATNASSSSNKYSEAIVISNKYLPWGCSGTEAGATGLSSASASNSNLIRINCGSDNAASECLDLNINGFSDWYLPCAGELTFMFSCAQNNPGFFPNITVWSSSEWSTSQAYAVDFSSSSSWIKVNKASTNAVVAVRFFN